MLKYIVFDWREAWGKEPLTLLVIVPIYLACLIPPLAYRWSLKATSVIYLPLLWVVVATFQKITNITTALKRLRQGDISRIVVAYSGIVLFAFTIKFLLMVSWGEFADWFNSTSVGAFASIYVAPQEIPIWQLTAMVNSVLAISLFVFAGAALFRIENNEAWPTNRVETTIRVTTFLRTLLTLYTISCTLYLTIEAASDWNLPRLGTNLFPWLAS